MVTQREGVSTQSVLGTPREPFLCAYVFCTKWCLQTNRMGGWEKNSLIIFLCLTRPSDLCLRTNIKMRDQNLVVHGKKFKWVGALLLTKVNKKKAQRAKSLNGVISSFWLFESLSQV